MKLLVALEARLATSPDGTISSASGGDGTGHPTIEGPRLTVAAVYGNVAVARRPLPPSSAATPHRTLAPLARGATEAA